MFRLYKIDTPNICADYPCQMLSKFMKNLCFVKHKVKRPFEKPKRKCKNNKK